MEKEPLKDPLVDENTGEIKGYQLKIPFDFPDNIKDTLTLQTDNQGKQKEHTNDDGKIPLSREYVESLYNEPDGWEKGDRQSQFPN